MKIHIVRSIAFLVVFLTAGFFRAFAASDESVLDKYIQNLKPVAGQHVYGLISPKFMSAGEIKTLEGRLESVRKDTGLFVYMFVSNKEDPERKLNFQVMGKLGPFKGTKNVLIFVSPKGRSRFICVNRDPSQIHWISSGKVYGGVVADPNPDRLSWYELTSELVDLVVNNIPKQQVQIVSAD